MEPMTHDSDVYLNSRILNNHERRLLAKILSILEATKRREQVHDVAAVALDVAMVYTLLEVFVRLHKLREI